MKMILSLLFILIISTSIKSADEETNIDTSDVATIIDSTEVIRDSTMAVADSASVDSSAIDSLTFNGSEGELSFEEKYLEHQKKKRNSIPLLSVIDSLITYFTSDQLNARSDVDMSFYHDAGDYFRFYSSYFVNGYQVTPMRRTVSPFGLGNSRLNLIFDGNQIMPFEHVPEPDGMVDINDIPTALDDEIYILSGPVGQLFGGKGSIASLVTKPKEPDSYIPESAMLADKGGYSYNFVRGRFSKKYSDGRHTDALIEYRNSDGSAINMQSDQYQYYGDFLFPLGVNYDLKFWGQLNDRSGSIVTRPETGGVGIGRDKFDRTIKLSLIRNNDERTSSYELGYKHIRKGSYLTGISDGSYNITGHGGFLNREWIHGNKVIAFNINADYSEYDEGYQTFKRKDASSFLQIGWLHETWRFALALGADWVEDFDLMPNGALVLFRKGEKSTLMLSTGYSKRAPTMHELNLPYQRSLLYGSASEEYVEQGNGDLKPEEQITGNLTYNYMGNKTGFELSITGGAVKNGIDWGNELLSDSLGSYRKFEPVNNDIAFLSLLFQPRLKIRDFMTLVCGASYNYLDYKNFDKKPYSPDYQFSSGMELHYYWSQKLMHLYAYGEIVYVGPYDGYDKKDLGQEMIVNAKLSFSLKDYRMHFVFQNVLGTQYQSREYITYPGRFFYYGFTWNFLN